MFDVGAQDELDDLIVDRRPSRLRSGNESCNMMSMCFDFEIEFNVDLSPALSHINALIDDYASSYRASCSRLIIVF
eukprot:636633-Pyramimonas_sp.AAC.1